MGCGDSRQRRHKHTDTGAKAEGDGRKASLFSAKETIFNSRTTFAVFCQTFLCVCRPYGSECELRDVCVGVVVAICCSWCVAECGLVCLGWKSGAGKTNSSALSFTPWGVAIVTPRLQRQMGRLFSLLTSAVTNWELITIIRKSVRICSSSMCASGSHTLTCLPSQRCRLASTRQSGWPATLWRFSST